MADVYDFVAIAIEAIEDDDVDRLQDIIEEGREQGESFDDETLSELLVIAADSGSHDTLDYLFGEIDLHHPDPIYSDIAIVGIDNNDRRVAEIAFIKASIHHGYDINYWTPAINHATVNGRNAIANWLNRWFTIPRVGQTQTTRYGRR